MANWNIQEIGVCEEVTKAEEPYLLEEEFKGKTDWQLLDSEFIDQAPDGLASALSFFSDEAFRFYLPAYLIADIDGKLKKLFCKPSLLSMSRVGQFDQA